MNRFGRLRSVAALLVLLAACAPPPTAQPTAEPTQPGPPAAKPAQQASAPAERAVAPVARPGGILRVAGEVDPQDLDPHTTRLGWAIAIMQHVYSGLVRAGEDSLPRPDLATRWEFTDPTTLEFTLRPGARFHNGREVVAEDVKYSLDRIRDPNVPSNYATTIASIASIETPDKYRVVLRLKQPDAALVNNLSLPAMAIVPREAVEPMPVGLKRTMVGSGPFRFKEQVPNQRLVLVKNPDYFIPGQPLLDELHFLPLLDDTARSNALRSRQVDYIEPVPPKDLRALQADRNLVVTGGPNISFVAFALNTTRKPYDDVRVRQALAYAIDRKEVVEKAFDGQAQALWGPPLIPPYWAGNADQYYKHDPEQARQLLAEAGYPNGFKTTFRTGSGQAYQPPLAAVVQSELKKVGIEVEIIATDGATASRAWLEGDFELYPIRWWGADFVDPDGALRPLFTCKGSFNRSRLCNEQVDDLILKGLTVTGTAERQAIYKEAMRALAEQQPWVFLVAFDRYQAMRAEVKGFVAYPNTSQYSFREVWLDR